jgi:hypothetical protein
MEVWMNVWPVQAVRLEVVGWQAEEGGVGGEK